MTKRARHGLGLRLASSRRAKPLQTDPLFARRHCDGYHSRVLIGGGGGHEAMEAARGARKERGPRHGAVIARDGRGLNDGAPKLVDARRRARRVAKDLVDELPCAGPAPLLIIIGR